MIKVKDLSESALAEKLQSHAEQSLIIKIAGIRGQEDSYFQVIANNLIKLISLTQLEVIIKKGCTPQQNGYALLSSAISELTKLVVLKIEIHEACTFEGVDLENLSLSLQKLTHLKDLTLKTENNNQINDLSIRKFITTLKLLPNLHKLDLCYLQILITNDACEDSIWQKLNEVQTLQNFKIKLNQQLSRNKDIMNLLDQISGLELLERLEIEFSEHDKGHLSWFQNLIKVLSRLTHLKNLTIKLPKNNQTNFNTDNFITQEEFNLFYEQIGKLKHIESIKFPFMLFENLDDFRSVELALTQTQTLKYINLQTKMFQSASFLQNLKNLTKLVMTCQSSRQMSKQFRFDLLAGLSNMKSLEKFSLDFLFVLSKKEDEMFSQAFMSLKNLKSLCFHFQLQDYAQCIRSIRYLDSLEVLDIGGRIKNEDADALMESISLSKLQKLSLAIWDEDYIRLKKSIFESLQNLKNLKSIDSPIPVSFLGADQHYISQLESIDSFSQLKTLTIQIFNYSMNQHDDMNQTSLFIPLRKCINLTRLDLSMEINLQSQFKNELKYLVNLQKLRLYSPYSHPIQDVIDIIKQFEYTPQLVSLHLDIKFSNNESNSFIEEMASAFSKLTNLQELRIADCYSSKQSYDALDLYCSCIKELGNLRKLTLTTSKYNFTLYGFEKLRQSLENNPNLRKLDLIMNSINITQAMINQLSEGILKLQKLEHIQFKVEQNFRNVFKYHWLINQILVNLKQPSTATFKYLFTQYKGKCTDSLDIDLDYRQSNGRDLFLIQDTAYDSYDVFDDPGDAQQITEENNEINSEDILDGQYAEQYHLNEGTGVDSSEEEDDDNNDEGEVSKIKDQIKCNAQIKEMLLCLEADSEDKTKQYQMNQMIQNINNHHYLQTLSMRVQPADLTKQNSQPHKIQFDLTQLKRLSSLSLLMRGVTMSQKYKILLEKQPQFWQSLQNLTLILNEDISFASPLFRGFQYCTNLVQLYVKVTLTEESAIALGDSLLHFKQLKHLKLPFQFKSNFSAAGAHKLIQGIKNLGNLNTFEINFQQIQRIGDENINLGDMLVNKTLMSDIKFQININILRRNHFQESSLVQTFSQMRYLQNAAIKLNKRHSITQVILDELVLAVSQLHYLSTFNFEAIYCDRKINFGRNFSLIEQDANDLDSKYINLSSIEVYPQRVLFTHKTLSLILVFQEKKLEDITLEVLNYIQSPVQVKFDSNIRQRGYEMVMKNLKYLKSPSLQLLTSPNSDIDSLLSVLKILPDISHIEDLSLELSGKDAELLMKVVGQLKSFKKLLCLQLYSLPESTKQEIQNVIIRKAIRIVIFKTESLNEGLWF